MSIYHALTNRNLYSIKTKKHEYISNMVYGLYDCKGDCFYVGKSWDIKKREQQHKQKFKQEFKIQKLKVDMNKNINWEKIYIQWFSLKYNLKNKDYNLKNKKVSRMDKNRLTIDYYPKYKNYKTSMLFNKYHLL